MGRAVRPAGSSIAPRGGNSRDCNYHRPTRKGQNFPQNKCTRRANIFGRGTQHVPICQGGARGISTPIYLNPVNSHSARETIKLSIKVRAVGHRADLRLLKSESGKVTGKYLAQVQSNRHKSCCEKIINRKKS